MSERAEKHRRAMHEKALRLAGGSGPNPKVDSSDWDPSTTFGSDNPKYGMPDTGPFEKVGPPKTAHTVTGEGAKHHSGRKSRKAGGRAMAHPDEAEDKNLVRSMVKSDALKKKSGGWIQGAIKHPGALRKELHVKEGHNIPQKKLEKAAHSDNPKLAKRAQLAETLKGMHHKADGGPVARASGGRTGKGKTTVNVIIAEKPPVPTEPAAVQGGMPVVPPVAAPKPMPAPPMPMPPAGGVPPGMAPPGAPALPRKDGGRTYPDMEYGAGSGKGRLEKIEEYGHKAHK